MGVWGRLLALQTIAVGALGFAPQPPACSTASLCRYGVQRRPPATRTRRHSQHTCSVFSMASTSLSPAREIRLNSSVQPGSASPAKRACKTGLRAAGERQSVPPERLLSSAVAALTGMRGQQGTRQTARLAPLRMAGDGAFACDSLPATAVMPSLVVFDLDNTLWTPELYQLRKRVCKIPVCSAWPRSLPPAKPLLRRSAIAES